MSYTKLADTTQLVESIFNNQKTENMKTAKGTAKPSGNGVGKGGAKTSPTDGGSLKPKGGGGKSMKKGGTKK